MMTDEIAETEHGTSYQTHHKREAAVEFSHSFYNNLLITTEKLNTPITWGVTFPLALSEIQNVITP
jgi:hypothetical protein